MNLARGTETPRSLWPSTYLLLSAVLALSLTTTVALSDSFLFLVGLLAQVAMLVAMLIAGLILLVWALVIRSFESALSIFVGMALLLSPYWISPIVAGALDDLSFERQRDTFDRMVAKERAHGASGRPVRMVVEYEDRSVFVTSNSFYFVIYEETDGALTNSESIYGYWRCPCSQETGVISLDGNKTIRHLAGHFYKIYMTY